MGGADHAAESGEAGRLPSAGQPETQSRAINVCTLNEYFSLHHQTLLPTQHSPAAASLCYGCSQHSAVFSGSSRVIIFFYLNFKIRSPTIKTIARHTYLIPSRTYTITKIISIVLIHGKCSALDKQHLQERLIRDPLGFPDRQEPLFCCDSGRRVTCGHWRNYSSHPQGVFSSSTHRSSELFTSWERPSSLIR